MNFERVGLVLVALVMLVSNAQASERAPIDGFLGDWMGVGFTEKFTEPSIFQTDYSIRDLDVKITATDVGLDVTWITHTRLNGTTKSKSTSVSPFELNQESSWEPERPTYSLVRLPYGDGSRSRAYLSICFKSTEMGYTTCPVTSEVSLATAECICISLELEMEQP